MPEANVHETVGKRSCRKMLGGSGFPQTLNPKPPSSNFQAPLVIWDSRGLGLRVQGSGVRVQGLGFRV